jgi:hypothetical protein
MYRDIYGMVGRGGNKNRNKDQESKEAKREEKKRLLDTFLV